MGMRMWAAAAVMLCASQAQAIVIRDVYLSWIVEHYDATTGSSAFANYTLHTLTFEPVTVDDGLVRVVLGQGILEDRPSDVNGVPFVDPTDATLASIAFRTGNAFVVGDYDSYVPRRGAWPAFDTGAYISAPYDVAVIPSVPEPSTWAMMFVGFLGLALVRAGRQRRGAAHL